MKIILALISIGVILTFGGCGTLKKRVVIDVEYPLYANLIKSDNKIKIKELHDLSGDVNLKTLRVTSDDVAKRLCGDKNDIGCIDAVLDAVDQQLSRASLSKSYDYVKRQQMAHQQSLKNVYLENLPSYQEDAKKVKMLYRVNDLTRFYKGSKIPFENFAYLEPNELKYPEAATHEKELHAMFPHPVEDFQANINQLHDDMKKSFDKDLTIYKQNIAYQSSFYKIVVKENPKHGDLSFRIQAPKKVGRNSRNDPRIIFHIVGMDKTGIYPYDFKTHNADLKFSLDHKQMTFTNVTRKDIRLEYLTLSYNGYTQDLLLGDNFHFSLIKAKSSTATPWSILLSEHFKKAAFYPKLTLANAKRTKVSFGITLTYKIVGQKKSKILKGTEKRTIHHYMTGW